MNTFNIEKYQIVKNEDIDVSNIPMLVRRKFSNLDKLVLTVLSKLYDNNIDEIIFTSKNGEFSRLKEIISQYQSDNMVSPTKFSASVHNFSVSAFSQLNKITTPYSAISAGEESLASGIISAITQPNKRICVCYADSDSNSLTAEEVLEKITKNIDEPNQMDIVSKKKKILVITSLILLSF